jgi:hypothetical protein
MANLPQPFTLTAIQGATFLYVVRYVHNRQLITLAGAGAGTWAISLSRSTTPALPRMATADEVKTALQALPRVGSAGVTVSSTTPGSDYTLAWAGELARQDVELVQIAVTAGIVAGVDDVPFDWTGWTADFIIRLNAADGTPTGTKVLELTSTLSSDGQVIFGYVFPAAPGGADGTPVLTNGNVAVKILPATTASLGTALAAGQYGASYVLMATKSGGQTQMILDGPFAYRKEPQP